MKIVREDENYDFIIMTNRTIYNPNEEYYSIADTLMLGPSLSYLLGYTTKQLEKLVYSTYYHIKRRLIHFLLSRIFKKRLKKLNFLTNF